jgi:hypothetical protein
VSIIIIRYTDDMKFYCFFHILLVLFCIIVYTSVCFVYFYLILYIMYSYYYVYVLLLLCMFRSRYCVSLCSSVYCFCANVYCITATGCRPNCSYQMYHIISYIIKRCPSVALCSPPISLGLTCMEPRPPCPRITLLCIMYKDPESTWKD